MQIRDAEPPGEDIIARVHRAAFGGEHGRVVADLVEDLGRRDVANVVSLIAHDDDGVIGHVMFTPALLDAPRELVRISVLSPIGVLPERQRRGVGRALIAAGIARLEDAGVPLVVLEGDPAYYGKLGFQPARVYRLRRPSLRIPEGAFQCRRLSSWQPWMTGTVVYSEPFWTHDSVGLRQPPPEH